MRLEILRVHAQTHSYPDSIWQPPKYGSRQHELFYYKY